MPKKRYNAEEIITVAVVNEIRFLSDSTVIKRLSLPQIRPA